MAKNKKKKQKKQNTPIVKMPTLKQFKAKISPPCHKGNNILFSLEQENSGNFLCGGWSRNAEIMIGDVIIDLTGNKKLAQDIEPQDKLAAKLFKKTIAAEKNASAAILHLYIPDGKVPYWDRKIWKILAADVTAILGSGTDILLCCLGGHGRTGIAAAILTHLIDPDMAGENPIQWVRDKYCEKVVENQTQIDYIHEVLGLPKAPESLKGSKSHIHYTTYSGGALKEDPNDGKECPACKKLYYCESGCHTKFHPVYGQAIQTPGPHSIEMTDAEMTAMENGTLGAGTPLEADWAKRFGNSW